MSVPAPPRPTVVDALSLVQLTEKQRWALRRVADGMTLKELAVEYGRRYRGGAPVSRQRVDYFLADVRAELGAKTTAQAIYVACKRGLI